MARRAKRPAIVVTDWRLAVRAPIEAYDEYTISTIELVPAQLDAAKIEGLIIDFRYVASDGETSRRSLLCWQCGRVGERIYVRGYCAFREELRTFRIDRMNDLIVFQDGRETPIDDVVSYFAAFAADEADNEGEALRLAARGD
jgi:predicted DNA-binding transcriptional regulator YafY